MAPAALVASTVSSACPAITGAVVSTIVTTKPALVVCPLRSLAEQFTVVVSSTNVEPEAGEHVTGLGPSTVSTAEAE